MTRWIMRIALCAWLAVMSLGAEGRESSDALKMLSDQTQWLNLDTSLRGAYWSSDRDLSEHSNIGTGTLWLRAQPTWSDRWGGKFEGWLSDQGFFENDNVTLELREAYLIYHGERFDLRVGRQIVVWGRADRINPTDNLSSRDYKRLFPEDDDQRRGNFMIRGNYAIDDQNDLSAHWLPEFRPTRIPIPVLPGTRDLGDDNPTELAQFAIKYNHSGANFDWSLSYFDGLDRNPDLAVEAVGLEGVTFQSRHHRIRAFGVDGATNIGSYGLRAEAAYVMTENTSGTNPEIKAPFLFAVLGADRSFFQYLNINLQYIFRYTPDFHNPRTTTFSPDPDRNRVLQGIAGANALLSAQIHRLTHGASVRVNHQWLNETLDTELAAVTFFNDGDFVLRPKITYKMTDLLRVTLGADYYSGSNNTVFGRLRDNTAVYFELRYGF